MTAPRRKGWQAGRLICRMRCQGRKTGLSRSRLTSESTENLVHFQRLLPTYKGCAIHLLFIVRARARSLSFAPSSAPPPPHLQKIHCLLHRSLVLPVVRIEHAIYCVDMRGMLIDVIHRPMKDDLPVNNKLIPDPFHGFTLTELPAALLKGVQKIVMFGSPHPGERPWLPMGHGPGKALGAKLCLCDGVKCGPKVPC